MGHGEINTFDREIYTLDHAPNAIKGPSVYLKENLDWQVFLTGT